MTEKQADEFVRSKLEDYLKKMGQKPDQAGRYHCIAKDHTDGNPSMTIHKSGTYAMCWSHPSPKDTFNIYDAIGIFEGLHSLRAQKQRAYAIYGLTIDETSATQPEKKGNDVKSVAPETPAPGKHKQPKAAPLQHAVAVPPPDMRTVAKQPVWPAPAKAAPPPAAAVTAEQPVKHPEENIAKSDEKLQIPQLVAKKDEALERSVAKPETQMTEKPVPADTPAPPQASSPTKPEAPKPVKPEDMPILSVTPVAAKPPLPPPAAVPPAHAEKPKPISPIPETKFEEKIEVPAAKAPVPPPTAVPPTPPEQPKPVMKPTDIPAPIVPSPVKSVSPTPEKKIEEKIEVPAAKAPVPPPTVVPPTPPEQPKPVMKPADIPAPIVPSPVKPVSPTPEKKVDDKVDVPAAAKAPVQPPTVVLPTPPEQPKLVMKPADIPAPVVPSPVKPVSPTPEKKFEEKIEVPAAKAPVPPPTVVPPIPPEQPKLVMKPADIPAPVAPSTAKTVSPTPEKTSEEKLDVPTAKALVLPSAPPAVARADTALSMAEQFQHLVAGYLTDKPLDTGFVALDAALDGGLYPGVYLLCARPGEGKTSFALQMADHIARQGHELCWISLDMTAREILVKSLSRLTLELDTTENKDQACTSRQVMAQLGQPDQPLVLERAVQAYQAYASRIRFIEQLQPLVLSDLILRLESLAAGGSRPVVVLDSLQYILPQTEGLNDVQQQDQSVRTLMQFSRRHHLPVLALSGVIRDSYASDVIVSLQMEPAEGTLSSPHQIRLEILKNRQGPAGQRQPYVFCAAYNAFAQR